VVSLDTVAPGTFRALGVPLLAGRDFDEHDDAAAPIVIVVNQSFAKRFFAGEDPIGKRVLLGRTPTPREIVGVVGDVRHVGLDTAPEEMFYLSSNQRAVATMALLVRAGEPLATLGGVIRARLAALDRDQPLAQLTTMRDVVERSIENRRLVLLLFGLFAAVALALATIGVYGVMSYTVRERAAEIDLRMALGAGAGAIVRLVVGQAVGLALLGGALGTAAAAASAKALQSLLFGVSATSPAALAGSIVAVLTIAALASLGPVLAQLRSREAQPAIR
jgi:putative ABC transport system permease protein